MKLKWRKLILVLLLMMTLVGCQSKPKELIAPEVEVPENLPLVTMEIKDFGTIQAELYPHIAPNTVNNFISLINQGFYNGLTIHRIEKGFVLQGAIQMELERVDQVMRLLENSSIMDSKMI